jgi:chromosomal replication initiation ATPase DnaA
MPSQLVLPLEPLNAMTRADFIAVPGNQRALTFLDSWPDWPASAAALFGPAASGKTHLARIWAERAGAVLVQADSLEEPVPGAAVVEDCDSPRALDHQSALFAMLEARTPLLLTGRATPSAWPVALPDLTSRFRSLVSFELGEPDETLLTALAVKLFADRQLLVPEAVVTKLIHGLERSPAAIRDFIAKADREALSRQKPVNVQLIWELIEDYGHLS